MSYFDNNPLSYYNLLLRLRQFIAYQCCFMFSDFALFHTLQIKNTSCFAIIIDLLTAIFDSYSKTNLSFGKKDTERAFGFHRLRQKSFVVFYRHTNFVVNTETRLQYEIYNPPKFKNNTKVDSRPQNRCVPVIPKK